MFFNKKNKKGNKDNYNEEDFCKQKKLKKEIDKINLKGKYQSILSEKVYIQAEGALDITDKLIESVEGINLELDDNLDNIIKSVDVSEEVGAFSEEVNASVQETLNVINEMMKKADLGQQSMNSLIYSIDVIKNTVLNMESALVQLTEKYNKIKGIVDTIKNISKTTHLLSLNANIEAARAGENGRGFSVVAGEVKKLAESSSVSADEIDEIIMEIISVTDNTLEIIKGGIGKVSESTDTAKQTQKSINELIEAVDRTKFISEQIGNSVNEQTNKNQYMVSVVNDIAEGSERVKSFNETISINAERQRSALNILKNTINNLQDVAKSNKNETDKKVNFNVCLPKHESFDPIKASDLNTLRILYFINIGLVQFGTGTDIVGGIAKSWHLEEDNVTWSFSLRKGLKFHNGREITARDVKYSYERLLSKKEDSPNRWLLSIIKGAQQYYEGKVQEVEGIMLNGDYNLKIVLEHPYSFFVNNLAHISCVIIPREGMQNIDTSPIGAGPFKFKEYDKEKEILVLEKFNQFGLGEALIDQINIMHDVEDVDEEFLNGKLDYITVSGNTINKIKEAGFRINQTACIGSRFITFNFTRNNPLIHNKKVRQAINFCIDKEKIIKECLGGLEIESSGLLPTILSENKGKAYKRNIAKAKELMLQSGIKGGKISLLTIEGADDKSIYKSIPKVLKSDLKNIGIDLEVIETKPQGYYEISNAQRADMMMYSWIGDSGTADNFIEPLVDVENSANRSGYNNQDLIGMINNIKKINNPYKYKEAIQKIENIILEDAPYIFLTNVCINYVTGKNVKGLKITPFNIITLQDTWKE